MNEGVERKLDADGAEPSPWEMSKKTKRRQMSLQGPKAQRQPRKRDTFMAQGLPPPMSPLVVELAERQQPRRGRRCRD
jgi:hypothetical protein